MKKCLAYMWNIDSIYHFNDEGEKINGPHDKLINVRKSLHGDVSDIYGDASNIKGHVKGLRGNITNVFGGLGGKYGDISNLTGDVSSICGCVTGINGDATCFSGDLDHANLSDEEREKGVNISDLWINH